MSERRSPVVLVLRTFVCCAVFIVAFALAERSFAEDPLPYQPPAKAVEPSAEDETPTCPDLTEVEPYEGEDDAAGEVRRLRVEFADVCAALAFRSDRLRERAWWIVAEAAAAREQGEDMLAAIANARCAEGAPCHVTIAGDEPGELVASDLQESIDVGAEETRSAIYLLAGLLAGCVIALMLWQTWRRAA